MTRKFKSISAITKNTWGKIAKNYYAYRESGSSKNELIEIPAMKSLIGNVSGLTVLDAGCGYGYYSIWAKKQGAKEVVGVDISGKMLNMAKKKAKQGGVEIKFVQGDLVDLGQFEGEHFDLIMNSMVVSYFADLVKYFSELARVLKKGGILVFSEMHPMRTAGQIVEVDGKKVLQISNYMPARFEKCGGDWTDEKGELVPIKFYHYPLSDFSKALKEAGFLIGEILEPKPIGKMKKVFPKKYKRHSEIPLFILIKAIKS